MADCELGRRRRIGHGLVQLHAGADQLVDQVGHIIAAHAGVFGRLNHGAAELYLLGLVDRVGLDRNVADDRLIIGADLGRHGRQAHAHCGRRRVGLEPRLARIDLLMPLQLQIGTLRLPSQALILAA
ncbi:hypothetical protein D3C76_1142470 [compost metagenome]